MQSHHAPRIDRRAMLKSFGTRAGAVAIGLPLLEEMMTTSAIAAANTEIPVRAFNVFFGLGIPAPLQDEGFDGVLEPLKGLSDKLLVMRGVDQVRCDQSGINAHFDGASAAFTAEPPNGEARAGGPSIDQVIRREAYPNGLPKGVVPTLVAGTFFRRSRVSRYVHSYNADGTVAAAMQERPRDLFERVFGTVASANPDETLDEKRLRRSVLDAVVDQYQFFSGQRSPLGSTSKARLKDHLDRVREYELRAFSLQRADEGAPPEPAESHLLHGGIADPGGEGIDISLEALTEEWRLMADLYALSIEMDRVRFGALTFLAAGERIRLTGDYDYAGTKRFTFNDSRQLNASGSAGCSHEWWHQFRPNKSNDALRAHAHMKLREVAYFLEKLDQCKEPNGHSILENSLITISTESGDGRHNDVKRELSGVFHACTSAGGRLKTGQITDLGSEGIDVYNTILKTFNCQQQLGPKNRDQSVIDGIIA